MTDIEKLIRAETDRLSDVPDELLSGIEITQLAVLPLVIELLAKLERTGEGTILLNQKNLELASTIRTQLNVVMNESDFTKYVAAFVKQFDVQKAIIDEILKIEFPSYVPATITDELINISKKKAAETLIQGIGDDAFAAAIADQVELAIANNAGFVETVANIQEIVVGNSETDGKVLQYAKEIAHDQFAIADRTYTSAVAEQEGYEWFFYSGSIIKTSRPFCEERSNKYYYVKEIALWGEGEKTGNLSLPDKDGDWDGKINGTNSATIRSFAGGWNCRHSVIPASIISVPRDVIDRNIAAGYFVPSEFEKKELGL